MVSKKSHHIYIILNYLFYNINYLTSTYCTTTFTNSESKTFINSNWSN